MRRSSALRRYRYVGPAEIRDSVPAGSTALKVTSPGVLDAWLRERGSGELAEPFTFVVGLDGYLLLAQRRSEHVHCAAGQEVLAAGEISFIRSGQRWSVGMISNQSTGYCPDPSSWPAVAAALDRVELAHPSDYDPKLIFRRCPSCHERSIVHDDDFMCVICDTPLPLEWNLG